MWSWTAEVDELVIAVPAWPLWLCLLTVGAAAVAWRWPHEDPTPPERSLATYGGWALSALAALVGLGAIAGFVRTLVTSFDAAHPLAFELFGFFVWSGSAGAGALALAGATLRRAAPEERRRRWAAIAAAVCGTLCASLCLYIGFAPGAPDMSPPTTWAQKGQLSPLSPVIPNETSYSVEPVTLPDELGSHEVDFIASLPFIEVRRPAVIRVRDESGPAGFPLRVGNRWTYRLTTTSKKSLYGGEDKHATDVTLDVVDTRQQHGVRAFRVRTSRGDQVAESWLAAGDGRLWIDYGTEWSELMHFDADSGFFFPPLSATCKATAEVSEPTRAVAGPTDCSMADERSSADKGAAAFAAVVSLGIATPGMDTEHTLTLAGSTAGPDDAAAAAVASPSEP